jgi:KaiC/GvpD/RAD55 family RecA-like ATPase
MKTSDRALGFIGRNWKPIPIPAGEKNPGFSDWGRLRLVEEDVPRYFGRPGLNIGILLGEASGWLVDVDLDSPETVELAPRFLPHTDAVFGRASKQSSHWLYYATGAKTLKIAHDKAMLVELRSTGLQTVFPGSVHPSGEPIEWVSDGEPGRVEAEQLEQAVRMLGEAARLVRLGWDKDTACKIAKEGRVEQAPAARSRINSEATFADAVARYNAANRQNWPRSGGTCPGCGHNDCFGRMPDDDSRWYCFSSSHTAPGLRGVQGYHGDALDLDAYARGMSRAELLRASGYLDVRVAHADGSLTAGAPKTDRPKLRFMTSAEYMDAWSNLPEVATIPTGITALDKALGGGLPASQVSQIVGGPGARKSELVRQIRNYVAGKGHQVLHVDAELTIGLLGVRDISQRSDLASAVVRDRKGWNDSQAADVLNAQEKVRALKNLWVLCTPPVPLDELSEAVNEVIEKTKDTTVPRLIILDSLQQLSFGVEAKERRHEVEKFIAWANKLAQTTGSVVLITSEKKRGNGENSDALHSAAESRSVEYQSAVVLVLEAEGKAEDEIAGAARSEWEARVRVQIAKNREGQKGKLPDALVFTGPSWGFKVEPAEDELADLVLMQLREMPRTATEIATVLKKRRQAVESVLGWLVDQGAVEPFSPPGRSHKKLYKSIKEFTFRSSDERSGFFARPGHGTSPDERDE